MWKSENKNTEQSKVRLFVKFLVAALFGAMTPSFASAQNFDCGTMPSTISIGQYNFSFKSWSWAYDNRHRLCHCVRNTSDRSLFAEWETTSLKGFVRPGGSSYVMTTHDEPAFKQTKQTLWYGASPTQIEADTLQYDHSARRNSEKIQALETVTLTSAPVSRASEFSSAEEMIEFVQEAPWALEDVEMTFVSSIDDETGRLTHRCEYRVETDSWESYYRIGFRDERMNVIMFGTDIPIMIYNGAPYGVEESEQRSISVEPDKFTFEAITNDDVSALSVSQTSLVIYSYTGYELAELPVEFYANN